MATKHIRQHERTTGVTHHAVRRAGPLLVGGALLWLAGFAGLPLLAGTEATEAILRQQGSGRWRKRSGSERKEGMRRSKQEMRR